MGLDIYLYPAAEFEADEAYEAVWEALYERKEKGEISEEEFSRLSDEERAKRPALNRWSDEAKAQAKSNKWPDHYSDRRYLRSSYNSGGFNSAVPKLIGREREDCDFYWIFAPLGREWDGDDKGAFDETTIPAWNDCKKRAEEIAAALRSSDNLSVTTFEALPMVGPQDHMWHQPPGEIEALNWFREVAAQERSPSSLRSYSCAKGDVFLDGGIEMLAVIPGVDFMGRPSVHVVYRGKTDEGVNAGEEYARTADVAAELCDEAISLIQRDSKVYFRWSG